ncbi:GNAT family N-acetyltransferase [Neobacillus sp. LXY-4]|uniref:GNAT family N-acetyltransferase n=1 Tax=Neobacillus sp. LXY-4 TaxID=3379826 RepID=UPI003EE0E0B1
MKHITFKNINHLGKVVFENELYEHIHNPEMLLMYDSNFIKFKRTPSLAELKQAEHYLSSFHLRFGQEHLKFYFPEGEKLTSELIGYLNGSQYQVGFLELYAIQPNQFPAVKEDPEIKIQPITNAYLNEYLEFQYEQDKLYGIGYAEQRREQHKRNFHNENVLQLLAYYNGIPAGSVDIILSEDTAEIDGLTVLEPFQKKGIGSRLQKYVMEHYFDKTVILVASGDDTPREMYRRQNYQYLGFKYEVMKVYQ